MPNITITKHNFVGGELSPQMIGRTDVDKNIAGLSLCQNMIVLPQGTVQNRAGTRYCGSVKNPSSLTRIIPFTFSNSQQFAIEFGASYFRFWFQGAQLQISPGVPYEVANPYTQSELFNVHYVQSGDIVTLVHPNHPPMELSRISNLNWTLTTIQFGSNLAAPATPTVVAHAGYTSGWAPQNFQYLVTALDSLGQEESLPSSPSTTVSNDLNISSANYNTITWTAVSGASVYNVYKSINGAFGFIGQVANAYSLIDTNITPDFTQTPPLNEPVFQSAGNYPSAVGYYEQRRFFGGTNNQPESLWGTQPGNQYNMDYSIPSQATDALRLTIAALRANYIEHIVTLLDLVALTASTEWRIFTNTGDALTPSTVTIKAQSQNGASNVQPVSVNNTAIYVSAVGGHIREMAYQWQLNGYQSSDMCLLAAHLFDNHTIVDLAFSRSPYPIVWAVTDGGLLLGMTYIPEQQVQAWHQHTTTNGFFESVCCVTEQPATGGTARDMLYCIVRRTIGGTTQRFVEYLDPRNFTTQAGAYFVDCGLSYNGSPQTTFYGLDYLDGQTVAVLGDGAVMPQQTVVGGAITLPVAASVVQVGLPIVAAVGTLPPSIPNASGEGFANIKNVNKVRIRVINSSGFSAGPDMTNQILVQTNPNQVFGQPSPLVSGSFDVMITPEYDSDAVVYIQQNNPLPLEISAISLEVSVDG